MTYCFKCPACGYTVETNVREPAPTCTREDSGHFWNDPVTMRRDYHAESVSIDRFRSFGDGKVHTEYVNQSPTGEV